MPADITADELDQEVRDELRALPVDLADLVARHLVAAERALGEDDPDQAYEHTKVGRRFAARIGVVREAAGIVAYRAGHFAEALSDLRAARRLTGSDAYLPVMADCERGLGRPERALDLVRSPEAERLDRAGRIELAIVESGARRDLGQHDAAVITLQRLPELRDPQSRPWSARLAFAYADALAEAGHGEAATDWFARAMSFDEDGETDAAERYAELTGAVIEDLEEDDEDLDGDAETDVEAEEVSDSAAFAEAGDLLGGDEPEATDEPEGDEAVAVEEAAADVESVEEPAAEEVDEPVDAVEDEPAADDAADLVEAVTEPVAEAEPEADKPDEEAPAAAGITPAFIEPDFGDLLDSPEPKDGKTES
ncbi:hypothetical protein [Nonomuraea endophytica]|uniref:Tetratricopeptide (TPR) repeat protein n=1 Tax=Nonomuraea endophytica TaxID=714136 RepID=A0A7W8AFN4_9ACTN|nr:hypothetical protein [Nonomuraea endophytica]MBB5084245.1 tetratricopeptide (TPR) repeat protein [Nonomuraea endophytica]